MYTTKLIIIIIIINWMHSFEANSWVSRYGKCVLLIYSTLTGSWASLQQLIFASHPRNPSSSMCALVIAAMQAEKRKHHSNDAKCLELGCVYIPLVVESLGRWRPEAQRSLSRLAGRLAIRLRSITTKKMYGRLNLTLIRANSRTVLSGVVV